MNNQSVTGVRNSPDTSSRRARSTGSLAAAFLVTLPIIPVIATLVSIATYISWPRQNLVDAGTIISPGFAALVAGTYFALMLWFVLAVLLRRSTAVDRANRESYDALCKHLIDLENAIESLFPEERPRKSDLQEPVRLSLSDAVPQVQSEPSQTPAGAPGQIGFARQKALNYLQEIKRGLSQNSTSWVLGSGYSKLWDLVDRAEESLLAFLPIEKVIEGALYDEMRLTQSAIANKDELISKLRTAVSDLDADSLKYFGPSLAPSVTSTHPSQTPATKDTATHISPSRYKTREDQDAQARSMLQLVRQTINGFKAKCWLGLMRSRNQLQWAMLIAGFATYVVVELVLLT
jgi:hypothetical protein